MKGLIFIYKKVTAKCKKQSIILYYSLKCKGFEPNVAFCVTCLYVLNVAVCVMLYVLLHLWHFLYGILCQKGCANNYNWTSLFQTSAVPSSTSKRASNHNRRFILPHRGRVSQWCHYRFLFAVSNIVIGIRCLPSWCQ